MFAVFLSIVSFYYGEFIMLRVFMLTFLMLSSSILFAVDDFEFQGRIHWYGNRYILKEQSAQGKWFILLENQTLERLLKGIEPLAQYKVRGKIFTFHQSRYILPSTFAKIDAGIELKLSGADIQPVGEECAKIEKETTVKRKVKKSSVKKSRKRKHSRSVKKSRKRKHSRSVKKSRKRKHSRSVRKN